MINEKLIPQIEKAFGFPLYEWQKEYLLGKQAWVATGRQNGKTFAYILNLLLSDGEPIKVTGVKPIDRCELFEMTDMYFSGYRYKKWFFRECLEVNQTLIENGIKTRIV